jgi:hypothetical protein
MPAVCCIKRLFLPRGTLPEALSIPLDMILPWEVSLGLPLRIDINRSIFCPWG